MQQPRDAGCSVKLFNTVLQSGCFPDIWGKARGQQTLMFLSPFTMSNSKSNVGTSKQQRNIMVMGPGANICFVAPPPGPKHKRTIQRPIHTPTHTHTHLDTRF